MTCEGAINIINNNMNLLSRNCPVAFVVGAAGFIGSHLVDRLLEKDIQVIGVDDFSSGKKENLTQAVQNKKFQLLNQSAGEGLSIDPPRLDYAFFVLPEELPHYLYLPSLENFLNLCKKYQSKIVLVSNINLYDHHAGSEVLKESEKRLASYSSENQGDARIVRLSAVYGPRMNFTNNDPMTRLILAATKKDLATESVPLDFTSRAVYIDDAIDLLIKAVMHGLTAQKIYDGALLHPLKITEVKQVLIDPVWYENKNFKPTELPAWPTPNLVKTKKELSWRKVTPLVEALKLTLNFFREWPEMIPQDMKKVDFTPKPPEAIREEDDMPVEIEVKPKKSPNKILSKKVYFRQIKKTLLITSGLLIIIYTLIYPLISLVVGGLTIKNRLQNSASLALNGDFKQAQIEVGLIKNGVESVNEAVDFIRPLRKIEFLASQFSAVDGWQQVLNESSSALAHAAVGGEALTQSLKLIAGEEGEVQPLLEKAMVELNQADNQLNFIKGKLSDTNFINQTKVLPLSFLLNSRVADLQTKIDFYQTLVGRGKIAAQILPQLINTKEKSVYLVVLTDNRVLRPAGGQPLYLAEVAFNKGKLTGIKITTSEEIDQLLAGKVLPPAEIRNDLNIGSWLLKDVTFDPDFPATGKLIGWFYEQATGVKTDGVISLDLQSLGNFSEVLSKDNNRGATSLLSGQSADFKPVFESILNQVFYLSNHNWPKITAGLALNLAQKHLLIYMVDPELLTYFSSKGWASLMPRQLREDRGVRQDFLALSEANLTDQPVNLYLNRPLTLLTTINTDGLINHQLTIKYSNLGNQPVGELKSYEQAVSSAYKARLKLFLTAGSKLTGVYLGNKDILKEVNSFSDYGRAGYSLLVEILPQEEKTLVFNYQDTSPVEFVGNKFKYQLEVIKQPGTDTTPLEVKLAYPNEWTISSSSVKSNNPEGFSFTSDLSQDRSFEIDFQK